MTYQQIKQIFDINNCFITEPQFLLLSKYVELLLATNREINLISRKYEEKIWENHILHSLSLALDPRLCWNDDWKEGNIIDIGTGGGLPGIPIKIIFPNSSITLLDSVQKKIYCISKILKQVELSNINCVCGRAEEVGKQEEYFRKFDIVVTRAVAPLSDLVQWSKLFLKRGGKLFALKGGNLEKELLDCRMKFSYIIQEHVIDLKGLEYLKVAEKKLIIVEM